MHDCETCTKTQALASNRSLSEKSSQMGHPAPPISRSALVELIRLQVWRSPPLTDSPTDMAPFLHYFVPFAGCRALASALVFFSLLLSRGRKEQRRSHGATPLNRFQEALLCARSHSLINRQRVLGCPDSSLRSQY